jgi:predicted methyltransferase
MLHDIYAKNKEYSCKDCKDRSLGCHDKCEKYKSFKNMLQTRNRHLKEVNQNAKVREKSLKT